MQDQACDISGEIEMLRNNQNKMLETKPLLTENKNTSVDHSADCTQLRKEQVTYINRNIKKKKKND